VDGCDTKGEVFEADLLEPCIADDGGKGLLRGELANALHKVLVGLTVVCHCLAHQRDHIEGVQIVYSAREREREKNKRKKKQKQKQNN